MGKSELFGVLAGTGDSQRFQMRRQNLFICMQCEFFGADGLLERSVLVVQSI